MFTCNPVSGDPSTVAMNASWGLGLAVVGGEVTPDEYRVSKVTREVLHRDDRLQARRVRPDPGGAGRVRSTCPRAARRRVPRRRSSCEALVDLARRIERHFGCHQDVEWAIARDGGDLFVLQSRPVTVAAEAAPAPRVGDRPGDGHLRRER